MALDLSAHWTDGTELDRIWPGHNAKGLLGFNLDDFFWQDGTNNQDDWTSVLLGEQGRDRSGAWPSPSVVAA